MRMSCNGCRVLRKGCSDDCSIRPCLQSIKTPESQSHATVFLAKFYGRAGLMNLINAGPEHLRPSIFKSLLYEACGRIVNPIYGSSGLLWSGNWHHCQAAVDAVLKGSPIMQLPSDAAAATHPIPPLKAYDIRHVSKESNSAASQDIHRVKTRNRFKRSAARPKPQTDSATNSAVDSVRFCNTGWGRCSRDEFNRTPSYDSTLVQQGNGDSREGESMSSVATGVASLSNRANPDQITKSGSQTDDGEVELELTLGLNPASRAPVYTVDGQSSMDGCGDDICKIELGPSYTCAP